MKGDGYVFDLWLPLRQEKTKTAKAKKKK